MKIGTTQSMTCGDAFRASGELSLQGWPAILEWNTRAARSWAGAVGGRRVMRP